MNHFMSVVCLLLLLTSSAQGQEFALLRAESVQKSEFENMIDLRRQTMQLACSEALKNSSELEIDADKRIAIERLGKDYKQKLEALVELKKIESEDNDKKVSSLIGQLDDLERRLANKILSPDQTKELHRLVFAQLVKAQKGDLASTLTTYYSKRFKFDDSQKEEMSKIESSAAEKIEEAQNAFDKELEKIAAETEDKVLEVLTSKQSELLEGLQSR